MPTDCTTRKYYHYSRLSYFFQLNNKYAIHASCMHAISSEILRHKRVKKHKYI